MFGKMLLYVRTIRNMKPSQVFSRMKKRLGLGCTLGVPPRSMPKEICRFKSVKELDYDAVFMSRFPANEFSAGRVTFLHETELFNWKEDWEFPKRSALWNFNLHYFEFLMPMVHSYEVTRDARYLRGVEGAISGWIERNPRGIGNGWASYTISIRIVYWWSCFFALSDVLSCTLRERMLGSLYEQYVYLSGHMEKDLLANHYLEDLKALVLCAIAFRDESVLNKALAEFKKQCKEQILPDGMHYELSPMYHKIALEAVLRVATALKSVKRRDSEIEACLSKMIDVANVFEKGMERVPLFNDGGNNVAKSLDAMLAAARNHFAILPKQISCLLDSGFYFFRDGLWTLIVDAGMPGPKENPGHVHCDAMSFELFHNGHPILVNCGTYAYQCIERSFFRSTKAHNTLSIAGEEQSECWGVFRMGRGSSVKVMGVNLYGMQMIMTDQHGNNAERTICLENGKLTVSDTAKGKQLQVWLHVNDFPVKKITASGKDVTYQHERQWYSEEYGARTQIDALGWTASDSITVVADLTE